MFFSRALESVDCSVRMDILIRMEFVSCAILSVRLVMERVIFNACRVI